MIPLSLAVIGLIILLYLREQAHDQERQLLLDRIQAPETVIAERVAETGESPEAIPLEDDEAYWEARKAGVS